MVPLEEELQDSDPTPLSLIYSDDAAFDGLARRSVAHLRLLIDRGPERGYFPEPAKYLFIAGNPKEKEVAKREFE